MKIIDGHREPNTACIQGLRGRDLVVDNNEIPKVVQVANTHARQGELDAAQQCLANMQTDVKQGTVEGHVVSTSVMYMLARLSVDVGLDSEAIAWYEAILEQGMHAQVCLELASLYSKQAGTLHRAVAILEQAVVEFPEDPLALAECGRLLVRIGRQPEGWSYLEKAVDLDPDSSEILSTLLWYQHFDPCKTREDFLAGYQRLAQKFYSSQTPLTTEIKDPDPSRRLRLGILAPDLRDNSLVYGFGLFFQGYDRERFYTVAYHMSSVSDHVTNQVSQYIHEFHQVYGMPYADIAQQIVNDEIDILLVLGGYVGHHGMYVVAYKPAPIIIEGGSISTTGLQQIDYRLTDAIIDPPETRHRYVEKSIDLPNGLVSFLPPSQSPRCSSLPAKDNGYITFGSFNVNAKINDQVILNWGRILQQLPDAHLVIKQVGLQDPSVQSRYLNTFQRMDISSDRIHLVDWLPYKDYWKLLGSVDIALDAYPYNGCITSLQALWMGVPVLTQTGSNYVSRVGLSLLSRLGLAIFSATSSKEYIAKAVSFAQQWDCLAEIRQGLRSRMLASPICHPRRFAAEIENVFRYAWQEACQKHTRSEKA